MLGLHKWCLHRFLRLREFHALRKREKFTQYYNSLGCHAPFRGLAMTIFVDFALLVHSSELRNNPPLHTAKLCARDKSLSVFTMRVA